MKSKGAACAAGNFSATSYYLNNLPLSFFTFSRYDKGAKQRCGAKLQLFLLFHFFLSSYFFHTEAAGGSCGFCISARPNFGGLPARRWLPCVGGAFRHAITAHKIRRPYIAPPGDFRFSLFPLLFSLKRTPRKIQGVRFSCHSIQTVVSTGSPWTYLWSQSSSKSRERRSIGHPRARSSARIRNSGAGSRHSR